MIHFNGHSPPRHAQSAPGTRHPVVARNPDANQAAGKGMKCGLGQYGGCNCGPACVCKEGPVFTMDEMRRLPADY
jgi:hypothetical protein